MTSHVVIGGCGFLGRHLVRTLAASGEDVRLELTLRRTCGRLTGPAAEVGENVRAGQPILMVEAAGKQWRSFNVREDRLTGLTMGETASVMRNGAEGAIKSVITELQPLGVFATWQAERVIGDHDRNTLRLRLDPQGEMADLEPGMTVWIDVDNISAERQKRIPGWLW